MVPSRPVAGNKAVQQQVLSVKTEVLGRARDEQAFRMDASKMVRRLWDQRIGKADKTSLDIKLRQGGLLELDYLCSCVCLLSPMAPAGDDDYAALLQTGWPESDLDTLENAIVFWRCLQSWSRLFHLDYRDYKTLPEPFLHQMLNDMGVKSTEALDERIAKTSRWVREQLEACLPESRNDFQWDEWMEGPVKWAD